MVAFPWEEGGAVAAVDRITTIARRAHRRRRHPVPFSLPFLLYECRLDYLMQQQQQQQQQQHDADAASLLSRLSRRSAVDWAAPFGATDTGSVCRSVAWSTGASCHMPADCCNGPKRSLMLKDIGSDDLTGEVRCGKPKSMNSYTDGIGEQRNTIDRKTTYSTIQPSTATMFAATPLPVIRWDCVNNEILTYGNIHSTVVLCVGLK